MAHRLNIYLPLIIIRWLEDIISSWKNNLKATIRQAFFNNGVVNNWNNRHFDVVNATSINSYNNKLDKCWENRMYVEWKV